MFAIDLWDFLTLLLTMAIVATSVFYISRRLDRQNRERMELENDRRSTT